MILSFETPVLDHVRKMDSDALESSIRIANLVAFVLMSPEEHAALRADIERRKRSLTE